METAADERRDEDTAEPGRGGGGDGNGGPAKVPTGRAAVDATAADREVSGAVQASALAYFMGEEPPPGRDDLIPLDVDFGTRARPNLQPCVFRPLAAEEFDKCEELAQQKNDRTGAVERIDPFVRWSYVYAYACQQPNLGQALEARRGHLQRVAAGQLEDAKRTPAEAEAELERIGNDISGLVREVFRYQPGVLQNVSFTIEKRSRMGDSDDRSVVEVEAGKISS